MEELARLVLLLVFAALVIRLVAGGVSGPDGVTAWLRAKFIGTD
ncbi:MAG TPA: hypothetical protein VMY78_09930 [Solirubrobacteraceae bacterium]|nr:hypothetical protein [Solirubrobacteraceae bacterium]